MPIFLSCFSAGSAGSSPTSSQNATLPSSSAWPLSASGYSSSFSSIASAPSIAGTAFLLPQLLHSQEKAPGSAGPVLPGVLPQAEVCLWPWARWQLSCQLCGGEWWMVCLGLCWGKMDLFHLLSLLASRSLGEETSAGIHPPRESWCEICVNSLLKVKHLQPRRSSNSTSREYFLHGSGGWVWGSSVSFNSQAKAWCSPIWLSL